MKALPAGPSTQLIGKEGEANDHLRNLGKDLRFFVFVFFSFSFSLLGEQGEYLVRCAWQRKGWVGLGGSFSTHITIPRAQDPLCTTMYHYNTFSKWRLLPFLSDAFYPQNNGNTCSR